MSGEATVRRGAEEIERLLAESAFDLRRATLEAFRAWLAEALARWERDPDFALREAIRELRRAHPRLSALEEELRRATAAYEGAAGYAALESVARELEGVSRAVAGLTSAVARAAGERRAELSRKLRDFEEREPPLREHYHRLLAESPERAAVLRLRAELERVRAESGVAAAEAELSALASERGRESGRSGRGFEDEALDATRLHLLPELGDPAALRVLRGVTLGAAGLEIDQLVVRGGEAAEPVEVLALVEAKRNPNDVGRGFRRRQVNLAWLTGDQAGYDPADRRTRRFPTGHFDRAALHARSGEEAQLDPASFARFRRDPATGLFLEGLYFVTRWSVLAGASSAALSRIRHRVATDERFALHDDRYLTALLAWARSLTDETETPEVLRLYARSGKGDQILVLPRTEEG